VLSDQGSRKLRWFMFTHHPGRVKPLPECAGRINRRNFGSLNTGAEGKSAGLRPALWRDARRKRLGGQGCADTLSGMGEVFNLGTLRYFACKKSQCATHRGEAAPKADGVTVRPSWQSGSRLNGEGRGCLWGRTFKTVNPGTARVRGRWETAVV